MITKIQAETLNYRDDIYSLNSTDSKGFPHRARVNGKLKTWKRDAARWELPMKFGMYDSFTLTTWNAGDWTLDLEEATQAAAARKERAIAANAARIAVQAADPTHCPQGCERAHLHE